MYDPFMSAEITRERDAKYHLGREATGVRDGPHARRDGNAGANFDGQGGGRRREGGWEGEAVDGTAFGASLCVGEAG